MVQPLGLGKLCQPQSAMGEWRTGLWRETRAKRSMGGFAEPEVVAAGLLAQLARKTAAVRTRRGFFTEGRGRVLGSGSGLPGRAVGAERVGGEAGLVH